MNETVNETAADDFQGKIGRTYRVSTPYWPAPRDKQAGVPNIVFIVLDDVGFSDIGCYGSEISTPNIDALASGGVRYNNFHVTAMCSPTRACLLTGRNAHAVGVGIIAEWSGGYPGYQGRITRKAATIPEVLREYGYTSHAVGKWHLTHSEHYGPAGPHQDWPLGRGFSTWYGFHGALTDQWNPELYQDNAPIKHLAGAGYHLSEDLVRHSIRKVRDHVGTSSAGDPFLLYLAFGACHWPHHVPREHIQKYRNRYDRGWDALRAARLARQIALGIVPPETVLAPRNAGVEKWSRLGSETRRLMVRQQEIYAAFLEHTDQQIGRLVSYLKSIDQFDNTLIVLLSDNGASPEGGKTGAFNLRKHMIYAPETEEVGREHLEKLGSEYAFNHYCTGWAQVSNTPLKWYKKGNHGGGIRAPLIVQWPAGIKRVGRVARQYHHVVDIAPTIYELLKVEPPQEYRGVPQIPIHGTSLAYTFDHPDQPTRKKTQYFELLGDRAIWHEGWKAVVRHAKGADFDADVWELYQLENDFSETDELASRYPDKLEAMKSLWWAEAEKFGVLPLDDREWERSADRPWVTAVISRYVFLPNMARVDRLLAPNVTDRSFSISADLDIPENGCEGVLLAWGSRFGGLVLYVVDSKPVFEYVYDEKARYCLQGEAALRPGRCSVSVQFKRTEKLSARAQLEVDGACVDSIDIPRTWPAHGIASGISCGSDEGAPVSDRYKRPFAYGDGLLRVIVTLENDGDRSPGDVVKSLIREQ